jgi:Tfp pilus assembly protein PilF
MAQALYDLAEAQLAAGQPQDARRQVLRALEIAPSFDAAQRLLLKLHAGGSDSGAKEQP